MRQRLTLQLKPIDSTQESMFQDLLDPNAWMLIILVGVLMSEDPQAQNWMLIALVKP